METAGRLAEEAAERAHVFNMSERESLGMAILSLVTAIAEDYVRALQLGQQSLAIGAGRYFLSYIDWTLALVHCGLHNREPAWRHLRASHHSVKFPLASPKCWPWLRSCWAKRERKNVPPSFSARPLAAVIARTAGWNSGDLSPNCALDCGPNLAQAVIKRCGITAADWTPKHWPTNSWAALSAWASATGTRRHLAQEVAHRSLAPVGSRPIRPQKSRGSYRRARGHPRSRCARCDRRRNRSGY